MLTVVISAVVSGLVIGALGRLVVPGKQNLSIWLTIAIGIIAALVGGLIAQALHAGTVITIVIQVALAAVGVALVAGSGRSRSLR